MKNDQNLPNKNNHSNNSSRKPLRGNYNVSRQQSPYRYNYFGISHEISHKIDIVDQTVKTSIKNNYSRSNSNRSNYSNYNRNRLNSRPRTKFGKQITQIQRKSRILEEKILPQEMKETAQQRKSSRIRNQPRKDYKPSFQNLKD